MWTCDHCGCGRIAASLRVCPQCEAERTDMPKVTVNSGASNAWADVENPEPEPEASPEPEVVPDPEPEAPAVAKVPSYTTKPAKAAAEPEGM